MRTLRDEPILGLKRLVLPVSYWRTREFAYVARQIRAPRGSRVLDLGSPKDLATILARRRQLMVTAVDILPEAVELSERYSRAQSLDGDGVGLVRSIVQDGRKLAFKDHTFDAAYAVSVLEHVPDEGDSATVRELTRVVRPGGYVILTVPYDDHYRETYVNKPVYERKQIDGPVFYQRHYDHHTLEERLIRPSRAELVDLEFWGEGVFRVERLLSSNRLLDILSSPFHPLLAWLFLREFRNDQTGRAMAAFLTLRVR